MQKIPAAQFKAQCLAVMDQVAESGRAVVVTKHGKPVVQILPVAAPPPIVPREKPPAIPPSDSQ